MKRLHWYDFITHNLYWLGLNMGSASLTPIIMPFIVQAVVAPDLKNTFNGIQRAAGLAVALVLQPAAGMLSDRSTSRWGRRRPFIVVGALFTALLLFGLLWAYTQRSFAILMGVVLLSQFASNIAHGALQGVIPDLVPEDQRGRASAVKAFFELLPLVLVRFLISPYVNDKHLAIAIDILFASYVLTMLGQVLSIRETPQTVKPAGDMKALLLRSLGMLGGLASGALGGVLAGAIVGGVFYLVSWPVFGQATAQLVGVGAGGLVMIVVAIVAGVFGGVQLTAGARKYPSFTWWVVNRLLFLAAVGSIQASASYFVQDALRVPKADAASVTGNLMMAVGGATLVAALSSGWLAERIDRRVLVAAAGIIGAVGAVGIVLSTTVTAVLVAGIVVGLGAGLFMTTNWALGTDLVPANEAGRFLGISNLAGAGAGIVGAGLGGPLVDFFNKNAGAGSGYTLIFSIFALCFVLSAVTLVRVKKTVPVAEA